MIKKNKSFLQKVGEVLNTSSETFMLVALIGLFVMPFVIAKNLDPIVKSAENSAKNSPVPVARNYESDDLVEMPLANVTEEETPNDFITDTSSVLGVSTVAERSNKPLVVAEDSVNLKFFDSAVSKSEEKSYELQLATEQVFGKIPLFTLTNEAESAKLYEIKAVTENKLSDRTLFIDNLQYTFAELPQNLTLEPGQSVTISVMSDTVALSSATLSVMVVENM